MDTKQHIINMEVTPDGNGDEMPGIFNIFSQLYPAVGTLFASVDLLYKKVSSETRISIYAENGFIIAILGLNNMANANLPAGVDSSDAKYDEQHGITWKIKYGTTGDDTPGVANVTATSSIDYRSFIDKDKIEWYTHDILFRVGVCHGTNDKKRGCRCAA